MTVSAMGSRRATVRESFQTLIKSYVGAGILAMPSAFKAGGLLASTVMLIVLAVVANYGIRCLIACSNALRGVDRQGNPCKTPFMTPADTPGGRKGGHRISAPPRTPAAARPAPKAASISHDLESVVDDGSLHAAPSGIVPGAPSSNVASPSLGGGGSIIVESYADIGFYAYGVWGSRVTNLSLMMAQLGFCVAYVSFISHNLNLVFPSVSRVDWILLFMALMAVFCQIRNIKYVAPTSSIGNVVYAFAIGSIFYFGFHSHCCVEVKEVPLLRPGGLGIIFGTAAFALEGIGVVIPLEKGMRERHRFIFVNDVTMVLVTILYLVFAVLCYFFFGDNTNDVITKNLGTHGVATGVKLSLSFALMFSYIIQLIPVSEIFDTILAEWWLARLVAEDKIPDVSSDSPQNMYEQEDLVAGRGSVANLEDVDEDTVDDMSEPMDSDEDSDVEDDPTRSIAPGRRARASRRQLGIRGPATNGNGAGPRNFSPNTQKFMNAKMMTPATARTSLLSAPQGTQSSGGLHDAGLHAGVPKQDGGCPAVSQWPAYCWQGCKSLFSLRSSLWHSAQGSGNSALGYLSHDPSFFAVTCVIRLLLIGFTGLIAAVFENFGLVVSLVGSLSNGAIAFVLPMMFYLKLQAPPGGGDWKFKLVPWAVIIVGGLASAWGVYSSLRDAINGDNSD